MDRKVDAIGIQSLGSDQFEIAEIGLKNRQISYLNLFKIDRRTNQSFDENYFRRNAGKIATVFPVEHSYINQLELPQPISGRSAEKILKMNAEVSLPISPNGHDRYGLVVGEEKDRARYLYFLFSEEYSPFKEEIELGMVQMYPGSLFQGFSEIFSLPKDRVCFLYYKVSEGVQIVWGMNGKVYGMRSIKRSDPSHVCRIFGETLSACPNVEYFFSWCSSEEQIVLEKANPGVKWTHLRDRKLPDILENKEESLPIICAAFVHALGYQNKCQRLPPEPSSMIKNSRFKRPIFTSLFLLLFLGMIFEISWLIRIKNFRIENAVLTKQIDKAFYSVFPQTTPMIDPVKQLSEKKEGRGFVSFHLRPVEFLKILSDLNQARSKDIKMLRISLNAGQYKVEGVSSSLEPIDEWVRAIESFGFKNVKLQRIDQRSDEGLFIFNLLIDLKQRKE